MIISMIWKKVAAALSDAHILVTGLSVAGDTLEDYFLSKIGGWWKTSNLLKAEFYIETALGEAFEFL